MPLATFLEAVLEEPTGADGCGVVTDRVYVGRSSSADNASLRRYFARSLFFSRVLANSNMPRSLNRISALVPSERPPSGAALRSMERWFAPNNGWLKEVDKIAWSWTESDSKGDLAFRSDETKINL